MSSLSVDTTAIEYSKAIDQASHVYESDQLLETFLLEVLERPGVCLLSDEEMSIFLGTEIKQWVRRGGKIFPEDRPYRRRDRQEVE